MTDTLLLDGSVPYHRYGGSTTIHRGPARHELGATPVLVFDPDGLEAHDQAIVAAAEAGEPGNAPLYTKADWSFALAEPGEPGQPDTERRVLAGWTTDGTFHRYTTAERLVQMFLDHLTRDH